MGAVKERGLHRKFIVKREDGADKPGGKHDGCLYFVLDLTHDEHALLAIRAYAESCRNEQPELADDLFKILDEARAEGRYY